jgi:hypothetical protein
LVALNTDCSLIFKVDDECCVSLPNLLRHTTQLEKIAENSTGKYIGTQLGFWNGTSGLDDVFRKIVATGMLGTDGGRYR